MAAAMFTPSATAALSAGKESVNDRAELAMSIDAAEPPARCATGSATARRADVQRVEREDSPR